jgi:hypothetical protein
VAEITPTDSERSSPNGSNPTTSTRVVRWTVMVRDDVSAAPPPSEPRPQPAAASAVPASAATAAPRVMRAAPA